MKTLLQKIRSSTKSLFQHEQWNIGLIKAPIQTFLQPGMRQEIMWLPKPASGEYRADPFGVLKDDTLHLFYERFDYSSFRGDVRCIEIDNPFELQNDTIAIKHNTKTIKTRDHSSYPFTFEHQGTFYCVPEAKSSKEITLYYASNFPLEWVPLKKIVSSFAGVDPTIVQFDSLWYLFCGSGESGHDLYIWYTDDLLHTWHPHPKNPVKSGNRRSRPGGTPFMDGGTLYRPAQDGTRTYGGSVIIYKIVSLSPVDFHEEEVVTIRPQPHWIYPCGLHTLSSVGDMTLIDAKRYVFTIGGLRHGLRHQFSKLRKQPRETVPGLTVRTSRLPDPS
jgi:hypothetical protein